MGNVQPNRPDHERERKELLKNIGILVPPMFGTGADPVPPPSSSSAKVAIHSLPHQWIESHGVFGKSPVSLMINTFSAHRLLGFEHLQAGIWVHAAGNSMDGTSTNGVTASCPIVWDNAPRSVRLNKDGDMSVVKLYQSYSEYGDLLKFTGGMGVKANGECYRGGGFFRHERSGLGVFTNFSNGRVDVGDDIGGIPTVGGIAGGLRGLAGCCFFKTLGTDGCADAKNGKLQNKGTILLMGSAMHFCEDNLNLNTPATVSTGLLPSFDFRGIRSWLALRGNGGSFKAGIEVDTAFRAPFKPPNPSAYMLPASYFMSFDITNGLHQPKSPSEKSSSMPIVLSVSGNNQNPDDFSATISQVIHFDRMVSNPIEDRSPNIRNTVSWAVEMKINTSIGNDERKQNLTAKSNSIDITGGPSKKNHFGAAIAWQVNRSSCFKVNANSEGVTAALILKRWRDPRVTCSLICGTDRSMRGLSFQGIGVHIETGAIGKLSGGAAYADSASIGQESGSEMRRELPRKILRHRGIKSDREGGPSKSSPLFPF